MINFARVANNGIILLVLAGFGYLIYIRAKNKGIDLDKFKGLFAKSKGAFEKGKIK